MKALIEEINDKLKVILNELLEQKDSVEKHLEEVQEKIDSKIDEAKTYKLEVDSSKEKIEVLESEIAELENDLKELTLKFSGKDLNAILETANKEINNKIVERQKEINKHKERINEFAEKARMIKDLLINLKKDKESKKYKLTNLTETYTYYERELNRIIEFSNDNAEELNEKVEDYNEEFIQEDRTNFDDIDNFEDKEGTEEVKDIELNESDISSAFDYNFMDESTDKKEETPEVEPEKSIENVDFKTLNDTIDKEYESIFGSSDDIRFADVEKEEPETPQIEKTEEVKQPENTNVDSNIDLFGFVDGMDSDFLNKTEETNQSVDDVVNLFSNNSVDFNKFNANDQETLRNAFDIVNYTKTLDILRKNNLDLNNIYNAVGLFTMNHSELETIINKLLLAGQTTKNISLVLNTIPMINSKNLQDVIDSYGNAIKDANITDLITKAKHLKELGGN